jgi:hypothetical protein
MKKNNVLITGLALSAFMFSLVSCEKETSVLNKLDKKSRVSDITSKQFSPLYYAVAQENLNTGGAQLHQINAYNGEKRPGFLPIIPQRTCSSGLPKPPSEIRYGRAVAVAGDGELYVSGHTIAGSNNGAQSIFIGGVELPNHTIVPSTINEIQLNVDNNNNSIVPFLFDAYVPSSSTNLNPIIDIEAHSSFYSEEPGVEWFFNDIFAVLEDGSIYGYRSNNQHAECHDRSDNAYQVAELLANVKTDDLSGSIFKMAIKNNYLYVCDEDGDIIKYKITFSSYLGNPDLGLAATVGNIGSLVGSCGNEDNFSILMVADLFITELRAMHVNYGACVYPNYGEAWEQVNAAGNGLESTGNSSDIYKIYDVSYAPVFQ